MIRLARTAALSLPLVVFAACGSGAPPWEGTELDERAWSACQTFEEAVQSAGGGPEFYAISEAERQAVLDDVAPDLAASAWSLAQDSVAVLGRTIRGPEGAWRLAADAMAWRCLEGGWPDGVPGG